MSVIVGMVGNRIKGFIVCLVLSYFYLVGLFKDVSFVEYFRSYGGYVKV